MARRMGVAAVIGTAGLLFGLAQLPASAQIAPKAGDANKTPPPTGTTPTTPAAPTPGSDPTRQRVPIATVDGVELDGTYYRGNKGRDTPCVILVHKFGSDRTKGDLPSLALSLQAEGAAVITFDLRGHGGSTQLSNPQAFWSIRANAQNIRGGGPKKNAIEFKDFKPAYVPMLVNDILAARRFLEQKNDAGELNARSIFVIGVQEGASLGYLFAVSEFFRTYRMGFVPLLSDGTQYNAGEDLAGCVFLGLPSRISISGGATSEFRYNEWIAKVAPRVSDKLPMCFIYGERDTTTRGVVDPLYKTLTAKEKGHKLDQKREIPGTDLAGGNLLSQPALGLNRFILDYCKKVMSERKAIPWGKMDSEVNRLALVNLRMFGFQVP